MLPLLESLDSEYLACSAQIFRMLLALKGEKLDGLNCKQMFALTISFEVCFQWSCQQLFTV